MVPCYVLCALFANICCHVDNHFDGVRLGFDDAPGVMENLMWYTDQKAVSALTLAICTEAQTS